MTQATAELEATGPERTTRTATLGVMAVCALLAAMLAYAIHGEALYAMGDYEPLEIEDFVAADLAANDNRYVRVRVELDSPAAKFRRPLEHGHYRVAKAGTDRWVVYAMPEGYAENRFLAPKLVAGRLVRAADLGARFAGVAETTGPNAWVVIDGDAPHGMTWLLGLETMLLGFMVFNLGGMASVVRPVR